MRRLEGFKDPWEHVVYKGKLLLPQQHARRLWRGRQVSRGGCQAEPAPRRYDVQGWACSTPTPTQDSLTPCLHAAWKILHDDEEDFSSTDDGF